MDVGFLILIDVMLKVCYTTSLSNLFISDYPYKSQSKSGADVRNGSVRFQILLKIY